MPKWVGEILKCNPGEKSLKAPFAIYLDLECLLKKEQFWENNPETSYTEKKAKHEPSGENYENKRKVKDHCHYAGKFRGAAYNKCNLNYKFPKDIPIIIHSAS